MQTHWLRRIPRIGVALSVIAAITYLFVGLVPVNATTGGFAYLVAILFFAARWGLMESIVGSVAAVLCFNFFFFPPVGTFTVADPQNWIALAAFLVTAVIASRLSDQVKQRASEALARRAEMERLYALSRAILLIEPTESTSKQITAEVARVLGAAGVTLFDRERQQFFRSGPEDFPGLDDQLRQAAMEGTLFHSPDRRVIITAIRLGSQPIASLGISGVDLSDSALQSLSNLVAIGLERSRSLAAASRAEAARQSDELKSMLMDAIAHEFQTPLTSIKAATTALLAEQSAETESREFLTIVDEEASRLSGLVADAIQMARVEAGRMQLHRESWPPNALIQAAVERVKPQLDSREVRMEIPPDLPHLPADKELVTLALRQLLTNAAKYSTPQSPITVSAFVQDGRLVIQVRDQGPGMPVAELPKVFDRFYRGSSAAKVPGAGLGLAIAKEVAHAHGGEMWAESAPGVGSTFFLALPLLAREVVR